MHTALRASELHAGPEPPTRTFSTGVRWLCRAPLGAQAHLLEGEVRLGRVGVGVRKAHAHAVLSRARAAALRGHIPLLHLDVLRHLHAVLCALIQQHHSSCVPSSLAHPVREGQEGAQLGVELGINLKALMDMHNSEPRQPSGANPQPSPVVATTERGLCGGVPLRGAGCAGGWRAPACPS